MNRTTLPSCLAAAICLPVLHAGEISPPSQGGEVMKNWQIGGIIFPNLHLHGIGGATSGDAESLAGGGHDPRREAFSAQAIEPGVSLRSGHIEGFANYLFFQDSAGDWDGELEEAFGKIVDLPGGFDLKAGRFLPHFGALNDRHLHAWDFVDSEMTSSRFLGDDGLMLEGAEAAWTLPLGMDPVWTSILSAGFGDAPAHDHDHAHVHGAEEPHHEAEGANLNDSIFTGRWMVRYRMDDFHGVTGGVSMAMGDNSFGRDGSVMGLDAEYLWRENGLEAGGQALRWRNEFLWRDVDAYSEHDEDGDGVIDPSNGDLVFDETLKEKGLYSHLIYTWNPHLDTALRIGWVEGVSAFGLHERVRVSPAVSWWWDEARTIGLRTQYNLDSFRGADDEHSLWFQVNIALGSNEEVR